MNAANATWDLLLNRPYDDGGGENSSRVYGPAGWDMQPPLYAATAIAGGGRINDPTRPATHWSAEVALPLAKLVEGTTASAPPADKAMWRINFSRVEWTVKVCVTQDLGRGGREVVGTAGMANVRTHLARVACCLR